MKSLSKIVMFILCVVIFLTLGAGPARAGEPVVDKWDIDCLNLITGPYAFYGTAIAFGVDEAVAEINAQGGIAGRPVEVRYYDTAMDPAKALTELNKFVNKSLIILGPQAANVVPAAMPLLKRYKAFAILPFLEPSVAAKYQPLIVSGMPPGDALAIKPIQGWLAANPGIKSAVQFNWPLDPLWMSMADQQRRTMEEAGIKVTDLKCSQGLDMSAAVIKALSAKPDAILINVGPVEAAKIVKELHKRGWDNQSRIMIFPSAAGDSALYTLAKGQLDGCYLWLTKWDGHPSPRWQKLRARWLEKFPDQPVVNDTVHTMYDMIFLIKEAIEKTGVTGDPAKLRQEREELRAYCRSVKGFDGVFYPFDYRDGIPQMRSYLLRVEDNDMKLVKEYDI